eukprot:SAG22_NODE_2010_length_3149_cov_1.351475_2_plen_72_part_00
MTAVSRLLNIAGGNRPPFCIGPVPEDSVCGKMVEQHCTPPRTTVFMIFVYSLANIGCWSVGLYFWEKVRVH